MNPWAKRLNNVVASNPSIEIKSAVRVAIASNQADDAIIDSKQTPETLTEAEATESRIETGKLSQLVDDAFPFDESQLRAIRGMTAQQYACLTGAAGTGKTTTTKKLVDVLQSQGKINLVNMKSYWKSNESIPGDDDYEIPDTFIPAIAMVGFTGRSAQMIKKNFPRDWHGNIMTIHRLLGFVPERYEDWDEDSQEYRMKMRFIPTYNAGCLMPWDIVIIDEAGMVGLDLWHQLWAAMKPGCRVFMIGDINQLPPVHGRSVFGFAMAKWPAFELTHIHRQVGANNAIVDNAWRILQGKIPVSEGRFQMLELKGDAQMSSKQVRKLMPQLRERGFYNPNVDTIITPINGNDGSRGYPLGQLPLNQEFSVIFNPQSAHIRYVIDGGREKKRFAVGDKVMATKNDHESGITNGMTGLITEIERHPGYTGDLNRFGTLDEVNAWLLEQGVDDDGEEFSLENLEDSMEAIQQGEADKKEKRDRGPSSHIVTVRFGDEEHGFSLPFMTLSEVGSLMTAYVVTCHKMQGGESPTIVIICHDAHKQMLYREWLYTAVTRASEKCILLYTPTALSTALNKQSIKGTTLKDKVHAFNLLQTDRGLGKAVNVILPDQNRLFASESEDDATPIESTALVVASNLDLATIDDLGSVAVVDESTRRQDSQEVAAQAEPEPSPRRQEAPQASKVIHHHHYIKEIHWVTEREAQSPVDVELTVIEDEPAQAGQIMTSAGKVYLLGDESDGAWQSYGWPADWSEQWIDDRQVLPVKRVNPWATRTAKTGV